MNARQFFERVKVMRRYQQEYFRTHSRTALQQSKALEREIDMEIDRVERLLGTTDNNPEPPNLFEQ